MATIDVKLDFGREFVGSMQAENATVSIGSRQGDLEPYDMMLGALGACFYANFRGIAEKMRLVYERAEIDVHGVKRAEVPTTLEQVNMRFTIHGAPNTKGFDRATELAAKYCSVHETIAKVADIAIDLQFAE